MLCGKKLLLAREQTMYDLFEDAPDTNRGEIVIPQFVYAKGSYGRELAKVTAYYRDNKRNVPNSHLLVRLLLSLNVSMQRDIQNFVDVATDVGMKISSGLRMTSSLNHGFVFTPGVFYGENAMEIIVADDTPFDVYQSETTWQDWQPVRVLRHPFTDLSMALPDGRYEPSQKKGLAVISINIPMLAAQWRYWLKEEKGIDKPRTEAQQTIHQFIAAYPIPNMVYSHTDICYFNRMVSMYLEEPVEGFVRTHPFNVIDATDKVDDAIAKYLVSLHNRHNTFDQILSSTPALCSDKLFDVMRLPEVAPTRQVKWALVIARLPLIRFLLKLNAFSDNEKNSWYLTKLRYDIREIRIDRVLASTLPVAVYDELERFIDEDVIP
jgi:hypothetical protein